MIGGQVPQTVVFTEGALADCLLIGRCVSGRGARVVPARVRCDLHDLVTPTPLKRRQATISCYMCLSLFVIVIDAMCMSFFGWFRRQASINLLLYVLFFLLSFVVRC